MQFSYSCILVLWMCFNGDISLTPFLENCAWRLRAHSLWNTVHLKCMRCPKFSTTAYKFIYCANSFLYSPSMKNCNTPTEELLLICPVKLPCSCLVFASFQRWKKMLRFKKKKKLNILQREASERAKYTVFLWIYSVCFFFLTINCLNALNLYMDINIKLHVLIMWRPLKC